MGLNPRQRRARARDRENRKLRVNCGFGNEELFRKGGEPLPPRERTSETKVLAQTSPAPELPTTPVTRRPAPPPSTEHPRYLLKLRRMTLARYSKARRVLLYSPEREKNDRLNCEATQPALPVDRVVGCQVGSTDQRVGNRR